VRVLGELGAETVSADELVHDLLSGDAETIGAVAARFGDEVRGGEGIDRPSLSEKVFGDPDALADLEGILHPRVRSETGRRAAISRAPVFVSEVPLLFEGENTEVFDLTVAVVTPEERRKAWALERGMNEERWQAIENRQLSSEEKAERANVVVENAGDLDKLREQARSLMDRLSGEEGKDGPRDGEE
jgi:dephospho-CoA kinase